MNTDAIIQRINGIRSRRASLTAGIADARKSIELTEAELHRLDGAEQVLSELLQQNEEKTEDE